MQIKACHASLTTYSMNFMMQNVNPIILTFVTALEEVGLEACKECAITLVNYCLEHYLSSSQLCHPTEITHLRSSWQ